MLGFFIKNSFRVKNTVAIRAIPKSANRVEILKINHQIMVYISFGAKFRRLTYTGLDYGSH